MGKKKKGQLIIVSGPSGCGKTTLLNLFFKKKQLKNVVKSVSWTTRIPRSMQDDSKDYRFVNEEVFKKKIEKRFFLEYQEVFGNLYGTPKKFVVDNINRGNDVVLSIDVKGAKLIKDLDFISKVFIFILPPSLKDLEMRLKKREKDTSLIRNRLKFAAWEIKEGLKFYDYFIVNKKLNVAVKQFGQIISSQRNRREYVLSDIREIIKRKRVT